MPSFGGYKVRSHTLVSADCTASCTASRTARCSAAGSSATPPAHTPIRASPCAQPTLFWQDVRANGSKLLGLRRLCAGRRGCVPALITSPSSGPYTGPFLLPRAPHEHPWRCCSTSEPDSRVVVLGSMLRSCWLVWFGTRFPNSNLTPGVALLVNRASDPRTLITADAIHSLLQRPE